MRILITGNMGYVGPVLIGHLRSQYPNAELIGFDSAFFAHCLTTRDGFPERNLSQQFFGDIRDIDDAVLRDVDAVVHLAAVSNDPMGNRFEVVTEAINQNASLRLAEKAAKAGVKNFVFASSCSVYGAAEGGPRTENDSLNPLTAYARSKIGTEKGLCSLASSTMTVTCLRFATACGISDRLRLDLVLNDFVACALSSGEITVLSDGTPWRPLIDVADMARAIEWGITRKAAHGGAYLAINAGSNSWNFQVSELAQTVAALIPGTKVSINKEAPPDKRSYQVDFGLFQSLAPQFQPRMTLKETVERLRDGLRGLAFTDRNFRQSDKIRLYVLDQHIASRRITSDLRWQASQVPTADKVYRVG